MTEPIEVNVAALTKIILMHVLLLTPLVNAGPRDLPGLPELYQIKPITDIEGRLHLASVPSNLKGISDVRLLSLKRSLVQFAPTPGLVNRTMNGYIAHQQHVSGLLRIDTEALTQYPVLHLLQRFDLYADLDLYAHDVHLTGLQFNFSGRVNVEVKRSLLNSLCYVLTAERVFLDDRAWDNDAKRYVAPPRELSDHYRTGLSRSDWEGLPHFERTLLMIPNVATGKVMLFDERGHLLAQTEEIRRSSHVEVDVRGLPQPRTLRSNAYELEPRTRFDDVALRKTRRIEIVYTHHLIPRGRPDAAIARVQTLAEQLKLDAPLKEFHEFSNDRGELKAIYDFHQDDYAREVTIKSAPRRLEAHAFAMDAFGRRLSDLIYSLGQPDREICEAKLAVERAVRMEEANRWTSLLGRRIPYPGAKPVSEAEQELERVKRQHHRLW